MNKDNDHDYVEVEMDEDLLRESYILGLVTRIDDTWYMTKKGAQVLLDYLGKLKEKL